MYRWLRNIHLVSGLFSFLFLFTYGWSAVQMAHRTWFSLEPEIRETQVAVGSEVSDNPRALARTLMDDYGLRGGLDEIKQTPEGYKLRISRPGTEYEVSYSRARGEAKVRTLGKFPGHVELAPPRGWVSERGRAAKDLGSPGRGSISWPGSAGVDGNLPLVQALQRAGRGNCPARHKPHV